MAGSLKDSKKRICLYETTRNSCNHQDKLSSLPDILLGNIVARLTLRCAVATSILSRRWRGLWARFITHIVLKYYSISDRLSPQFPCSSHGFFSLIDHILRQVSSPHIHTFILGINHPWNEDEIQVCTRFLESWLPQICSRNPKVIHIFSDFCKYRPLLPLPTCIFECQSLEDVLLYGNYNCKLPYNKTIILPNLKKLDVYFIAFDFGYISALVNLIKSCPLLETLCLTLKLSVDDVLIYLCAPNLKYCEVVLHGTSQHRRMVLFDAPKLINIFLRGRLAFYVFLNQPRNLLNAIFSFDGDTNGNFSQLIQGISSVKFLKSSNNLAIFNGFHNMGANPKPIFHNLTMLSLDSVSGEIMNQRAPIPVSLLRKLKYVEIVDIWGDDNDIKLIKHILRYANVLEELLIWVTNLDDYVSENGEKDQLWMEYNFCKELFQLPKRSSACKIKFEGFYILEVSSDNKVEGGVFSSNVNYLGRKYAE